MNDRRSGVLVVLEAGAHWPRWVQECSSSAAMRVIVEQPTEGCASLADRVVELCEGMRARGSSIQLAVLACGDRADIAANVARRGILRSLADTVACADGGRLLLTADTRQRGTMRRALCNIARDIATEWQTAHVALSVRFSDEPVTLRALARRVA